MRKKYTTIGILFLSITILSGCNGIAKQWGGTVNVDLPVNKKLVNVTWKDSNLWYLTRDMKNNESEETYEFIEESNYGLVEGKVILKEHKE